MSPTLQPPVETARESFLAAMAEFVAEGRGTAGDETMLGGDLRRWAPGWESPPGFASYCAAVRAEEHTASRPGWVTCTTVWYVEGSEYLGRLAVRHELTPHLLEVGGHIGYDVRPSARRRGHGTAMLRAGLPLARNLGITSALVTCDDDNVGSRKIIEANGGVLEDVRGDKLRFWVPTDT